MDTLMYGNTAGTSPAKARKLNMSAHGFPRFRMEEEVRVNGTVDLITARGARGKVVKVVWDDNMGCYLYKLSPSPSTAKQWCTERTLEHTQRRDGNEPAGLSFADMMTGLGASAGEPTRTGRHGRS